MEGQLLQMFKIRKRAEILALITHISFILAIFQLSLATKSRCARVSILINLQALGKYFKTKYMSRDTFNVAGVKEPVKKDSCISNDTLLYKQLE